MKKLSEMKYQKLNLSKIKKDLNLIIEEFNSASNFEEQDKAFKKYNRYMDHLSTNITIASIRYSQDALNEENAKNQEELDASLPELNAYTNLFTKALLNAEFRKEFEEKYGSHLFKIAQTQLECFDEKIIPELQKINALTSEYTKVIASAQIEYHGETYNLSQLGKFACDKDREVRKEASLLSAKFFETHDEEIGRIWIP